MDPGDVQELIGPGRDALSRGAWEKARSLFASAAERHGTAEAYEGLADACWWLRDEAATFDARERAFRLYRAQGNRPAAAKVATWLATDSVEFRGQPAVASGWLQRAHRLLEGFESTAEYGWLLLTEGHLALMLRNDAATAAELSGAAVSLARSRGVLDLEMMALAVEGLALVTAGRISEGMPRLDEAAAAAVGDEMTDLNAMGTILCYLMDACDRVRDYDRASQWCERVRQFAESKSWNDIYGVCRPHYAVVLMWRGAWDEAETELSASIEELERAAPPMAVEGIVRLGELRWRQGRWDEADALFERVGHEPLAQLGRAELLLGQGDAAGARDLTERYLRRIPREDRIERAGGLELLVRTLIALGATDETPPVLEELADIAEFVRTAPLRASASYVRGLAAAASGDLQQARQCLEDAVDLYERCGAPFDTARARIDLASVLRDAGRGAAASKEASSALRALEHLGAAREAARAAALVVPRLGASDQFNVDTHPDHLSEREIEVLRLIASGKSNQEIAAELVLSVRTVERHISNIYDKIGAAGTTSRAIATAYALRTGVLRDRRQ